MTHGVTVAQWRSADDHPDVPTGNALPVIVARKSDKGKWYVFGAVYLNAVEIDEDGNSDDDDHLMSGFACDFKHDDYDTYYEAIDVLFWAPMPLPPGDSARIHTGKGVS